MLIYKIQISYNLYGATLKLKNQYLLSIVECPFVKQCLQVFEVDIVYIS